jgi:hypothetical protein
MEKYVIEDVVFRDTELKVLFAFDLQKKQILILGTLNVSGHCCHCKAYRIVAGTETRVSIQEINFEEVLQTKTC